MPVLTLTISDEAFVLLRTAMGVRIIADAAHGVPDEVMRKIVGALDRGDTECRISTRAERARAEAMANSSPAAESREPSPNPTSEEIK